jgi:hypothetical protein
VKPSSSIIGIARRKVERAMGIEPTGKGLPIRFMADKMRPGALFRTRSARLLPPLLFVTAVIVPPIAYVTVEQWFGYQGGFIAFLGRYFTADNHFCQSGHCMPVPLPNYAHLWFVCYLWIYTVLLIGLLAWAPRALSALQRGLKRALRGWGLILWPVAYLGLARFALEGRFPQSLDLIHDWYNHVIYLGGFLFGFSIAKSDAIWTSLERIRARTLSGALVSYATIIILGMVVLGPDFDRVPKVAPEAPGSRLSVWSLNGRLRTFRHAICLLQRSRSIRATKGNPLNFDIEA